MIFQKHMVRQTRGHRDMHDLTEELQQIVQESGIVRGIATLCNIGSTAALGTIEFEPGLEEDLPEMLDRLIPPSREYGHERALARRQRPLASPGDPARSQPERSHRRGPPGARKLAAGFPDRVRHPFPPANGGRDRDGRVKSVALSTIRSGSRPQPGADSCNSGASRWP